ncbi:hypothetical protein [Xanthomonas cassavae]|uniref:hypothetical protein n=1 Tax=Xanthomonas cassavae TaxID=56450 RepID=UPI00040C5E59
MRTLPSTDNLGPEIPLPRQTRAFIVLVALLQGGLLYLAALGAQHDVRPFTELGVRICWYTLVMTAPSMLLLSLQQLRDRCLWQHVELTDLEQIRKQIIVAAGKTDPPADWWTYLLRSAPRLQDRGECTHNDSRCIVSSDDLDRDGQPDVLLCDVKGDHAIACVLYARNQGGWYQAGTTRFYSGSNDAQTLARQALRDGQVQARPSRGPDLVLPGDRRMSIKPTDEGIRQERAP